MQFHSICELNVIGSRRLRLVFEPLAIIALVISALTTQVAVANELPIADMHVHYSHDSVDLTPPERVIELMQQANLKFALVSSSDDKGTKLLRELAPELIVPELRPYRRRGELGSWFKDQGAIEYVERLLESQTYAGIGEFHLYGDDALLPIPRRIVELAEQYNLILHAHSDIEAVAHLLALSDKVKVLWAHSGFEEPKEIAQALREHDRLWADLAFRSEMHYGPLSADWKALFEEFPDRMMLGTDTYTPERMYYLPEHAVSSREWLKELPDAVAERVAWKNGYELIMPVWQANQYSAAADTTSENSVLTDSTSQQSSANPQTSSADSAFVLKDCNSQGALTNARNSKHVVGKQATAYIKPLQAINVSESFALSVLVCGNAEAIPELAFDATMPAHGHGMNYTPEITPVETGNGSAVYLIEGVVFHMPGSWQYELNVSIGDASEVLQIPERI